MKNSEDSGSYVAVNENPIVLCSYGYSAADAFKQMSKLLKKNMNDFPYLSISAVHSSYEEGVHFVTVYI
jgi:hypothetical protein